MGGRRTGAMVLGASVLLAILVPALARPPLTGLASRPPAIAPVAGDCVTQYSDSAVEVTPCSAQHTGEVQLILAATVPSPTSAPTSTASDAPTAGPAVPGRAGTAAPFGQLPTRRFTGQRCFADLAGYFTSAAALAGSSADTGWIPATVDYTVTLIPSDPQTVDAAAGGACVITPRLPTGVGRYTGTLAAIRTQLAGSAPRALHQCFTTRAASALTGCTQRHDGELLAGRALPAAAAVPADLPAQCLAQARTLVGATDPTFGGRVQLVGRALPVAGGGTVLTCSLWTAAPTSHLVGSVLDLESAALPLVSDG